MTLTCHSWPGTSQRSHSLWDPIAYPVGFLCKAPEKGVAARELRWQGVPDAKLAGFQAFSLLCRKRCVSPAGLWACSWGVRLLCWFCFPPLCFRLPCSYLGLKF